jgi:predicted MPP superfamily phosphohydrolase
MAPKELIHRALDFNARKVTSRLRLPYGEAFYSRRWLAEPRLDINRMCFPVNHGRLSGRGIRIVQISDLHLGNYVGNERLLWLARRLESLDPDVVFITGDFVNRSYREALPAKHGLKALAAVAPTYGVLGNHDFWHAPDKLSRLLERSGMRILRNEHVQVRINGNPMVLAGVDDFKTGNDDLEKAARGMPEGNVVRVLLSHCPDLLQPAAEHGFDLVLAGHTHGAQLRFPILGRVVNRLMHGKYERGWMKAKETALYINRGLGVVFIPVRYGSDAEVTVLNLTPATTHDLPEDQHRSVA